MAELQNTESTSPVQAKDTRVYYNYGDQKIDLKHYIHNLDSNLERFLSTRTNWSSEQKDAFKSKYAQLKQGLEDQLATGNDRFSTDFNGITTDSVGEIANGQDLLYLDGSDDYDGAFDVSKELGKYIDKIGGTIVLQGYTKDYYDKLFQEKLKEEQRKKNLAERAKAAQASSENHETAGTTGKYDPSSQSFVSFLKGLGEIYDKDTDSFKWDTIYSIDNSEDTTQRAKNLAELISTYKRQVENATVDFSDSSYGSQENYLKALKDAYDAIADGYNPDTDNKALNNIGLDDSFLSNWFSAYSGDERKTRAALNEKSKEIKERLELADTDLTNSINQTNAIAVPQLQYNYYDNLGKQYAESIIQLSKNLGVKPPSAKDTKATDEWFNTLASTLIESLKKKNTARASQIAENLVAFDSVLEKHRDSQYRLFLKDNNNPHLHYLDYRNTTSGVAVVYDSATKRIYLKKLTDLEDTPLYQNILQDALEHASSYKLGGKFIGGGELAKDITEQTQALKRPGESDESFEHRSARIGWKSIGSPLSNESEEVLTSGDIARIGALAANIGSVFTDPVTGAAIGVGADLADLYADINDKSVSGWDAALNLGTNLGLDLVALIPGGEYFKIAKSIGRLGNTIAKGLAAYGILNTVANGKEIAQSLKNVVSGDYSREDVMNSGRAIMLLATAIKGGTNAYRKNKIVKAGKAKQEVGIELKDTDGNSHFLKFFDDDAARIRENQNNPEELKKVIKEIREKHNADFPEALQGDKNFTFGTKQKTIPLKLSFKNQEGKWFKSDKLNAEGEFKRGFSPIRERTAPNVFETITLRDAGYEKKADKKGWLNDKIGWVNDPNEGKTIHSIGSKKSSTTADIPDSQKPTDTPALTEGNTPEAKASLDDATEAAIRAKGEEVYNTRLKELEAQSEAKRQKGQEARREYRATEQTKKLEEAQLESLQKEYASISTNADILKTKQSELAKLETKLSKAQPQNKRKATKEQKEYIKELQEKKKNLEKEIKYYSSQQPNLWDMSKQDLVSQIAEQQRNIESIKDALKLKRAKRAEIAKESGGKAELEEILKEGLKVTIKDKDGKEITSIYQPTIPEGKKVNDVLEEIAGRLRIIRKAGGTIRLMKSGGISGVGHKGSPWEATVGKSTWDEIIKKLEENPEYYKTINEFQTNHARLRREAREGGWTGSDSNAYQGKDNSVGTYQSAYQAGGWNNIAIKPYYNSRYDFSVGRGPNNRTSKDSPTSGWNSDNLYAGITDDRRLLGRYDQGLGDPDDYAGGVLNTKNEQLRKYNLQIYLDRDGYYKIKKIGEANPDNGQFTTAPVRSLDDGEYSYSGESEESQFGGEDPTKQSKSKIVENLKNRIPNILDAARVAWLNRKNVKAGQIAKQQYPIYEDPFAIYRAVYGDYRKIAQGEQTAAALNSRAATPLTSNGDKQTAYMLEAALKGEEAIRAGMDADDKMYRNTQEVAWERAKENAKNAHDVAQNNRAEGARVDLAKKAVDATVFAKNTNNIDTWWKTAIKNMQDEQYAKELKQEQMALADIKTLAMSNPQALGVDLTHEEQLVLAGIANGSITLSSLPDRYKNAYKSATSKVNWAITNATRRYYGLPESPYKDAIMEGLNNNYASISAPQDDTTVTFKKGGQITVAKIKEKIKNADRLQKAIFKQIDSLDKQIDRLSKAAFSKPNKPIRAK